MPRCKPVKSPARGAAVCYRPHWGGNRKEEDGFLTCAAGSSRPSSRDAPGRLRWATRRLVLDATARREFLRGDQFGLCVDNLALMVMSEASWCLLRRSPTGTSNYG